MKRYGVIPYRRTDEGLKVLLITSRKDRAWGIPKGHPEPGMTPLQSACLEAYEEAGVRGRGAERLLGTYARRGNTVGVFPLEVEEELAHWPEKHQRRRVWVSPAEAVEKVPEDDLKALLDGLEERLAS